MKLLFICGSLVPGRDGVGDYTRLLADELTEAGHEVLAVASHDRGVSQVQEESQPSNRHAINVVRIPFATGRSVRMNELQARLDDFTPDWLSLQYVPFSFSKYGIPSRFINGLCRLQNNAPLHVMFHELWIVPGDVKGLKGRFVATMQRRAVSRLVSGLQPAIVHTHLPAYAARLQRLGIVASALPLFANVVGVSDKVGKRVPGFNVVFFSKIFFPPEVVSFLRKLKEDKENLTISLLGGSKEKAIRAAETLRAAVPGVLVDPVGFLSEAELADRFGLADLAVSPVPLHLLGKSGTVAAFLSYNLPVAAPRIVEEGSGFFIPELNRAVFSTYCPQNLDRASAAAAALDVSLISTQTIGQRFVKDLKESVPAL